MRYIRGHTGEYLNECKVFSNMTNKTVHCGESTERKCVINLKTSDLFAHLCDLCNFVQLDLKNMVQHLKNQHETKIINENDLPISNIKLLPALNSLRMQTILINQNAAIIPGK